jgi:hypothetical protein
MAIARGTDAANAALSHTISHSESLKLKQTRGLHRDLMVELKVLRCVAVFRQNSQGLCNLTC